MSGCKVGPCAVSASGAGKSRSDTLAEDVSRVLTREALPA